MGPLLFLIYMNDIPSYLNENKVCLYADDISVLNRAMSQEKLNGKVLLAMERAEDWFESNGLILNQNKTQHLLFTTSRKDENKNLKLLGLTIDNKLNWSSHITTLADRLSSAVYSIRYIKSISTHEAARMCYFANFHSLMMYGLQFWGNSPSADRIFLLQKRAIRALCGLKQSDSCRPYFRNERILTMASEYILTIIKHVHANKSSYNKNCNIHDYNTRRHSDLRVAYHRLKTTQNSASYWGVKLYNLLPSELKCQSLSKLTCKLKSVLLDGVFYTIEEFTNHF